MPQVRCPLRETGRKLSRHGQFGNDTAVFGHWVFRHSLGRLGEALNNAEAEVTEKPEVIAALRLLVLTGARYSEILGLRWDWVDVDEGRIRLPDSRTGFKVVHLNAPARKILDDLPRNGDWILPGAKEGKHLVNLQKPWRRIRSAASLDDVKDP